MWAEIENILEGSRKSYDVLADSLQTTAHSILFQNSGSREVNQVLALTLELHQALEDLRAAVDCSLSLSSRVAVVSELGPL